MQLELIRRDNYGTEFKYIMNLCIVHLLSKIIYIS